MSGRTPAEAVNRFVAQLQQAAACVTHAVMSVRGPSGYQPALEPHVAALNRGAPAPLQGPLPLRLQATLLYTILRGQDTVLRRVQTVGYIYGIRGPKDAELLAYHWHPTGRSRVTWPHLHVNGVFPPPLFPRTHLPTGRVALQDLVRLAIEELGVPSRRADRRQVLRTHQALEEDEQTQP